MTAFAGINPKYLKSSTYQARLDFDIFDIVTDHLRRHQGEWVHIEDIFNIDPWLTREIVARARHIGDVIVTRGQGKPGYMYVGYCRRRWVRASDVWPPKRRARDEEPAALLAGQMSLAAETA